jgi:hypothetical protein
VGAKRAGSKLEMTSLNSHFPQQKPQHKMLRVVEAGGVEGGSIALMAIDVKAVADELGIPMLL